MSRPPRSPLVVLLLVALLALPAAPALAQVGSGSGASPFAPRTETAPPVADADRDDGGIPGWAEALIIASGAVLVLGIGFAITRDARGRAGTERERVREASAPRGAEPAVAGDGGPAKHPPRAKQQARARAKRARQSRKRNR